MFREDNLKEVLKRTIVLSDFSRIAINAEVIDYCESSFTVYIPDYSIKINFIKSCNSQWIPHDLTCCYNPKWIDEIIFSINQMPKTGG
jgi:hypothetical protein